MRLSTWQVTIGVLIALALLAPTGLVPAVRADQLSTGPSIVEHDATRLIVRLRPDEDMTEIVAASAPAGAEVIDVLAPIQTQILEVAPDQLQQAYDQLRANPHVAEVSFDTLIYPAYVPNDPHLSDGSQWAPQKINAATAWDVTQGNGVIIAIVDSGVDPNHPDLRDRLVPGYNVYDSNMNTSDACGHGTHLAGIAAATADNGEGIAGIAPQAKIMPVRVLNDSCGGSYSRLISGINYAADHGARVIVISSGATVYNSGLHAAVTYARSKGSIVVAAAGNYNSDTPFYPAAHPEAIAVSGTDKNDNRYSVSNYGSQIDIAAPAPSIYSTYVNGGQSTYAYMGGTSMAAPHVGGVAALLFSLAPGADAATVEDYLTSTAVDLGDAGWDVYFGNGRIDAQAAVNLALGGAPTPEPPTPTPTPTEIPPTPEPPIPTPAPTEVPPTPTPAPTEVSPTPEPPTPTPAPTEIPPTPEPPTPTPTPEPPTPTPTPTEIPPTPAARSHVESATLKYNRRWFDWQITANVLIADASGTPIESSTVAFAWSGAYSGTATCVTARDGRCSVTSKRVSHWQGSLALAVNSVSHAVFTYDPAANRTPNPITDLRPQSANVSASSVANVTDRTVNLRWLISNPGEVQGVALYRSFGNNPEEAQRLANDTVLAQGASTGEYEYTDPLVSPDGVYTYWLVGVEDGEDVDLLGTAEVMVGMQVAYTDDLFLPMLSR